MSNIARCKRVAVTNAPRVGRRTQGNEQKEDVCIASELFSAFPSVVEIPDFAPCIANLARQVVRTESEGFGRLRVEKTGLEWRAQAPDGGVVATAKHHCATATSGRWCWGAHQSTDVHLHDRLQGLGYNPTSTCQQGTVTNVDWTMAPL